MNDMTHALPSHGASPPAGCWTCKVRRKKCDGDSSICNACKALNLNCYNGPTKPEWMDGGARQEDMTEWFKTKVKENAHRRRAQRSVTSSSGRGSPSAAAMSSTSGGWIVIPQKPTHATRPSPPQQDLPQEAADTADSDHAAASHATTPSTGPATDYVSKNIAGRESLSFGQAGTVLITFYLENLFPFLFPFHRPSILQGGRAWILELVLKSPVVRQAVLCQSSYFFSLAQGMADQDSAWVFDETQDAFQVMRQALQVINEQGITDHLHGAVRIFASIVQLQRFEVAVTSFDNCRAHLSAAIELFRQILNSGGILANDFSCPSSCFNAVVDRLRLSSSVFPGSSIPIPIAEQAAFQFSSSILIFDDIIASTVLQDEPQLYEYHRGLLIAEASIKLDTALGCENWVLLMIGETAALDAWKQRCKRAGNLDVVELVRRATLIKASIKADLERLEAIPTVPSNEPHPLLGMLAADHLSTLGGSCDNAQMSLITRIWAHAAIIYLSVVTSGWQPASDEVQHHVQMTLDLLSQIYPVALLRAVCWPLCVVGCLALPRQEAQLRHLVQTLQPPRMFGTLYKALEIMEAVWRDRNSPIPADFDFAACFRGQDGLVLLV